MQVLAKPICVVSWTDEKGVIHPVRIKVQKEDESEVIIKVDRVIITEKEKLAGNEMLLFRCQSVINNQQRLFELKYELKTCKWMLFKM